MIDERLLPIGWLAFGFACRCANILIGSLIHHLLRHHQCQGIRAIAEPQSWLVHHRGSDHSPVARVPACGDQCLVKVLSHVP